MTWSGAIIVASMGDRGVYDPEPVAQCRPDMSATTLCTLVRTGDILPDFAVDRSGTETDGYLYAVWQSHVSAMANGSAGDDTIFLSRSTDGGLHWDDPVKVNDTTAGKQAFTAAVHVAADGTVAVTYYDFRNDVLGDDKLTTDYWVAHSHDGGQTFGASDLVTKHGSFDMRDAPYARGYFVGDYAGLTSAGNVFKSFFDVGTPGVPSGSPTDRSDNMWASAG